MTARSASSPPARRTVRAAIAAQKAEGSSFASPICSRGSHRARDDVAGATQGLPRGACLALRRLVPDGATRSRLDASGLTDAARATVVADDAHGTLHTGIVEVPEARASAARSCSTCTTASRSSVIAGHARRGRRREGGRGHRALLPEVEDGLLMVMTERRATSLMEPLCCVDDDRGVARRDPPRHAVHHAGEYRWLRVPMHEASSRARQCPAPGRSVGAAMRTSAATTAVNYEVCPRSCAAVEERAPRGGRITEEGGFQTRPCRCCDRFAPPCALTQSASAPCPSRR